MSPSAAGSVRPFRRAALGATFALLVAWLVIAVGVAGTPPKRLALQTNAETVVDLTSARSPQLANVGAAGSRTDSVLSRNPMLGIDTLAAAGGGVAVSTAATPSNSVVENSGPETKKSTVDASDAAPSDTAPSDTGTSSGTATPSDTGTSSDTATPSDAETSSDAAVASEVTQRVLPAASTAQSAPGAVSLDRSSLVVVLADLGSLGGRKGAETFALDSNGDIRYRFVSENPDSPFPWETLPKPAEGLDPTTFDADAGPNGVPAVFAYDLNGDLRVITQEVDGWTVWANWGQPAGDPIDTSSLSVTSSPETTPPGGLAAWVIGESGHLWATFGEGWQEREIFDLPEVVGTPTASCDDDLFGEFTGIGAPDYTVYFSDDPFGNPLFNVSKGKIYKGREIVLTLDRPWRPGQYILQGGSYDGYTGRALGSQPFETWRIVEFRGADGKDKNAGKYPVTRDLVDGEEANWDGVMPVVDEAGVVQEGIRPLVILTEEVTHLVIRSGPAPASSNNGSVHPVCVGATEVSQFLEPQFRIMAVGDSITQGCCSANSGNTYRYPLFQQLTSEGLGFDFVGTRTQTGYAGQMYSQTTGWDMDHEGYAGNSAKRVSTNLMDLIDQGGLAAPDDAPDIALVHLGTNERSNSSETTAGLEAVIDQLRRLNPEVTVILAKPIPCTASGCTKANLTALYQAVEAAQTSRHTATSEVVVVDMGEAFGVGPDLEGFGSIDISDFLAADGVHPTVAGDEAIADAWRAAMPIAP